MATAGKLLSISEFTTFLLAGLGQEYDSCYFSYHSVGLCSLKKFMVFLSPTRLASLTSRLSLSTSSPDIFANISTKQHFGQFSPHQGRGYYGSRGRGYRGSCGGRNDFLDSRPICSKSGHTTLVCYNRWPKGTRNWQVGKKGEAGFHNVPMFPLYCPILLWYMWTEDAMENSWRLKIIV